MKNSLSSIISSHLNRSPFIREAMDRQLINITALARYLQPDIEREYGDTVTLASIIMTINRLPISPLKQMDKSLQHYMSNLGDIIVRSDLVDFSFTNSPALIEKQSTILQDIKQQKRHFYSVTTGMHETTLVVSKSLKNRVLEVFKNEQLVVHRDELSAVSVMLPSNNQDVHGVYYTLLKQIAWNGINLIEVISTSNEITLVVANEDVEQVFSLFNTMKKTKH